MKAPLRKIQHCLHFRACGGFLLAMIVLIGVGAVHQYIHLEAEADCANHDPQTCPQCQTLKTLGTEEPQIFDSRICCIGEAEINPCYGIPLYLVRIAISRPQNRSPPPF